MTWITFAYSYLNGCEHKKHWKMANYVNHRPQKTKKTTTKTRKIITFSTKADYLREKSGIIFFSYFNNLSN